MVPDPGSLENLLKLVGGGALASLLFIILWGGWKKEPWWVFARHHDEVVKLLTAHIARLEQRIADLTEERDQHLNLVLKTVHVAERMVESHPRKDQS